MILTILICKLPGYFLPSFESTGFSVQKKKRKIDFQDGSHGGQLGFLIGTILAFFGLQVDPILSTKFRVNQSFNSVRNSKWIFKMAAMVAILDF